MVSPEFNTERSTLYISTFSIFEHLNIPKPYDEDYTRETHAQETTAIGFGIMNLYLYTFVPM